MSPSLDRNAEWLETDGLGGFASGTVDGIRTRRYHAVLQVSLRPPTDRVVLVNGFDVWLETPGGNFALASHRYTPEVVHPDGARRLVGFSRDPWPTWTLRLEDGTEIIHELTVPRDLPVALVSWRLAAPAGARPEYARLVVRPLISCRDAHTLHQENESFRFDADEENELVRWHPYHGIPGVVAIANAEYTHDPVWYRNFLYTAERERGLECTEDLASPGILRWDLSRADAALVLTTDSSDLPLVSPASVLLDRLRAQELGRRRQFATPLHRSAEAYLVRRGDGRTLLAGYPWATDWGRVTFIGLRGLCLATGRLDDARQILLAWTEHVSGGMLPSYFADRLRQPEFGAVDASLWYVVAVHEYLQAMRAAGRALPPAECTALRSAVGEILNGYASGTRYRIHLDDDGLLAAGEPGVPLTWMNARLGEWVATPRIGKPVEVQALWLNALRIGSTLSDHWAPLLARGLASFLARFWNREGGYLYDVVDADHRRGAVDATFRPNQIFAVGGLPYPVLGEPFARRVVDTVEARLLTPLGLRSLAPNEPGYVGRHVGSLRELEVMAHQGTAWPWLLGPFVEAWVRVRGDTPQVRREARRRFLTPVMEHLEEAGLGHISELADADLPHTPRGAPFDAWSMGEVLRLLLAVLPEPVARDAQPSAPVDDLARIRAPG